MLYWDLTQVLIFQVYSCEQCQIPYTYTRNTHPCICLTIYKCSFLIFIFKTVFNVTANADGWDLEALILQARRHNYLILFPYIEEREKKDCCFF